MSGRIGGRIITRAFWRASGRNDITISTRSFDMPRKASSTWNVNAGSDVTVMMNKMRGSVP